MINGTVTNPAASAAWALTCCLTAVLLLEHSHVVHATMAKGPAGSFFFESFGDRWTDRWHYTAVKKYQGVFETVKPKSYQDTAIQIPEGNLHYGMAAILPEPLTPAEGVVIQYEVQFAKGHTCGGAYLKLVSKTTAEFNPSKLKSKTPFSIMFGPDRCGPESRVHVILNVLNPVTQETVEHHLMSAPGPKGDALSHVYTLALYSNHRYKVLIDGQDKGSGLLTAAEFSPPLQPPETLPDPDHVKPDDWVEEETIDDPAAGKPADWDDRRLLPDPNAQKPFGWLDQIPARIADPDASKPADWNDAADGEWLRPSIPNPACEGAPGCGPWKAPMIKNPVYKGPWIAPQIKNPNYKGPWQQRQLHNPAYFHAAAPLTLIAPIVAVALELWVTEPGYIFDSILIGRGEQGLDAAAAYLRQTWRPRFQKQYEAAMAAARAADRPPGFRYLAANFFLNLLDTQLLHPLKVQLEPAKQLLQQNPEVAWAAAAVPVALLGWLLLSWVLRARQAAVLEHEAAAAEDQAAEVEHKAMQQEFRKQQQAAKQAAAARAVKAKAEAAAAEAEELSSSPAAGTRSHRRGQRSQQRQEGNTVEPGTPVEQQQKAAGSPESDGSTGRRTRVTRQSARQA